MTELGTAYVSIAASTGGLGKDITSAVTGGMQRSTARAAGIGGALGGVIGAGLTMGIGAAWQGLKTVVGAGLTRALNIEDAQAKLRGLGHDTQAVESIMDSALQSVEGTAFGLDAAATVAASAVAAGIEPGEELTGVLTTVANTSAAAGTSMEEMGGIFGKVASTGKAQNDSLQQIADRGIPIYQALADQLGVTTDEVFEMASAGEIGFAEFEEAAASAAGNVAEEMGGTVRGSLSNLKAAVGRVGAGFFTPLMDSMRGSLAGVTGVIDSTLGPIAATLGEGLANIISSIDFGAISAGIQPVVDAFASVDWGLMAEGLGSVVSSLGTAAGAIGLSTWNLFAIALQVIAGLLEGFAPLLAAVGDFMQQNQEFITLVVGAWSLYRGILLVTTAAQWLLNTAMAANPVGLVIAGIVLLISAFIWLWNNVEGFRNFFIGAWEGIKGAASAVAGWFTGTLVPWFQGVWAAITAGARAFASWIGSVWTSIRTTAVNIWNGIISFLGQFPSRVWAIFNPFGGQLMQFFARTIENVRQAFLRGFDAVVSFVASVPGRIMGALSALGGMLSGLASSALSAFGSAISAGIETAVSFFASIPGRIMGFISGLGSTLYNAGANIVQQLASGIRNAIGAVTDAIGSVVSAVRDFLPFSPAKTGPLSGSGWPGYSGEKIPEDLAWGINRTTDDAATAAGDMAAGVSGAMRVGNRVSRATRRTNTNLPAGRSEAETVAAALANIELTVDGRVLASSTRKAMVDQNIWPVQARVKRAGAYG